MARSTASPGQAGDRQAGEYELNIILVTGATARARTITLDWRHWIAGGIALLVAVRRLHAGVQLRDAQVGGGGQAPVAAGDRARRPARRRRSGRRNRSRDTSTRWRSGWASCRRRCCGSTASASASPRRAGLKPQELPARRRRTAGARRRASRRLPGARPVGAGVHRPARAARPPGRTSAPTSSACSRRCWSQDSANRKFLPTLPPVVDGWYSSNFGYRIDPFTGQNVVPRGHRLPGRRRHADRRRGQRQGRLRG